MKTWSKRILLLALLTALFFITSTASFASQHDASPMILDICEHSKRIKNIWSDYTSDADGHVRTLFEVNWCDICNQGYFPYPIDWEIGPHEYGPHRVYGSDHSAANPRNHYTYWIAICDVCGYYDITRQPAGCTEYGCVDLMSLEPEPVTE